jgi:mRNA interferase RelE/StbE
VIYELDFHKSALKEWSTLDKSVRVRLQKKLQIRLASPHVRADALSGKLAGCYRLKDNASGYRLVYRVIDDRIQVFVLSIDKREKLRAYLSAAFRYE